MAEATKDFVIGPFICFMSFLLISGLTFGISGDARAAVCCMPLLDGPQADFARELAGIISFLPAERTTALPGLSATESLSPMGRTMAGCVDLTVFGLWLLQMRQSTTQSANAPSPLHRRPVGFVKEVQGRRTRNAGALHCFAQVIRTGKRTCFLQVVPP
jgi:hypothetical protein